MPGTGSKHSAGLTIGVVAPQSGRLAKLGDPLMFVTGHLQSRLRHVQNQGRRYDLRLVSRDSRSEPDAARKATEELIREDRADVIVTLAGTAVLPAVADTCEARETPCVTSTFPWQVYYFGRGATTNRPFRWTYHFCWGLDDIATVFAEMWEIMGARQKVGCLWNDGPQGNWSRHEEVGFLPVATALGHHLIDPAGYSEPATDFTEHIAAFTAEDVDVITSAATGADLALFRQQAARHGLRPRLVTCSRWLAYPVGGSGRGVDDPAEAKVASLIYWTPRHPYRSSLDGMRAAELAEAYERVTGNQWLQPLGLAYALFEVATHALSTADDPTDGGAVAAALGRTRVETMAGPLDWTTGPVPNVATVRLVGGQWKRGDRHPCELAVVANSQWPELPLEDEPELLR
ncbi:ABC transporter substrate-binding protein [Streptomyces halobius]|uniref:ABC transporter substrate-binding protein n=1 Tax=Streptomyces halobius TaxID=2879846 RepID=A0ABY4LZD9_9ACTN|nr:ABC transporter substrate-binding protein [Streptomyces halobius]UQA90557.1 ABC transporter substrate-binding protein [Streptomyces halobius]